jgi:hypothetical protein
MKTIAAILSLAMLIDPATAGPYPTPTHDGRDRIPRTGSCPPGYVGIGAFCETLHRDTPRAYPVIPGRPRPAGTVRSGGACAAFR